MSSEGDVGESGIDGDNRKKQNSEDAPLWIKVFGGSLLSIAFLSIITLTGYIVSNLNNLQSQLNVINTDMITKKEFLDRTKLTMDAMKVDSDNIANIKERLNALEQIAKDRQIWMEKYEVKISDANKAIENTNRENATLKEKSNAFETQMNQIRDEIKQFQKDVQTIRERIVIIEGKGLETKP